MSKIYRIGQTQLAAERYPYSWDSIDIIVIAIFPGSWLWPTRWTSWRKQTNLSDLRIWNKILKNWKQSSRWKNSSISRFWIWWTVYTDWSALNIAGVPSQKQDGVESFIGCWGCKWEALPIYQKWSVGFSEDHEQVGAYFEVQAPPPFSIHRRFHFKVHSVS